MLTYFVLPQRLIGKRKGCSQAKNLTETQNQLFSRYTDFEVLISQRIPIVCKENVGKLKPQDKQIWNVIYLKVGTGRIVFVENVVPVRSWPSLKKCRFTCIVCAVLLIKELTAEEIKE